MNSPHPPDQSSDASELIKLRSHILDIIDNERSRYKVAVALAEYIHSAREKAQVEARIDEVGELRSECSLSENLWEYTEQRLTELRERLK